MQMLKNKYDFAFSLGGTCTAAESLRRASMQFASFPFDWAGGENVLVHARDAKRGVRFRG